MAVINFVKGEQYYTAEFQINGPVNVHIERAEAGALYFRQRSIDHGSYDLINGANWNNRGDLTIDTAIQGVVYPMWIKIESASEPTLAEMVEGESSGGGAGEIVYVKAENIPQGAAPMLLSMFSVISAVKNDGAIYIMPPSIAANMFQDAEVVGVGYMPDMEVVLDSGKATIAENFAKSGVTEDVLAPAIITKEEFYNLEA